ncbi:hypothetical protein ACEWY4_010277 [Coilia grayii]|uniref:TF_AP-2 domain-containing protein n=1 Tax=Coilia grayii TaxID=363190 RepID=A0ABD1K1F3_9TELE
MDDNAMPDYAAGLKLGALNESGLPSTIYLPATSSMVPYIPSSELQPAGAVGVVRDAGRQPEDMVPKKNLSLMGEQSRKTPFGGLAQESEQVLIEVESVLRIPDGTKAKRYKVSREELVRRCGPQEGYSPNALVAYLRKGKSQKEALMAKLHDSQVKPGQECLALAHDVNYMGFKYLPIQEIGQACVEEDQRLEAIVKAKNCRQTLTKLKTAMEASWSNYNIATHGLGPEMLKGAFAIFACLAEAENLHCL